MMQKIYLSRAMTRAMSLDHPIGDPFGGPAYGERREPISAIMSIGAMVGSAGAFTAATTTLGAVMAGVSFAGAALSLIGNVTGNSTLSKIGMVAGIAGGIGMGADALFDGGNFTFSGGDAAKAPEWLKGAKQSLGLTPNATPVAPVEQMRMDAAAELSAPTNPLDAAAQNLTGSPGALNAPGAAANPLNVAPGSNPLDNAVQSLTGSPVTGAASTLGGPAAANTPAAAGGLLDSAKGAGKSMMNFIKDNPGGAYVAGSAVSGLSDWLSGKSDAEIAALQAQVGFADARAVQIQDEIAREKQRRANLNQGWRDVDTSIRVNPNVNIPMPWEQSQQPQQPGLVAGAMPRR